MKICVFGTTLQAGVIAGLFAEYGHQVVWCPQVELEHQTSVSYQDEHLNQLILKQQSLIEKLKEYRASIISHAGSGKIDLREFGA